MIFSLLSSFTLIFYLGQSHFNRHHFPVLNEVPEGSESEQQQYVTLTLAV